MTNFNFEDEMKDGVEDDAPDITPHGEEEETE